VRNALTTHESLSPEEHAQSEAALADFVRGERVRFVFVQSAIPIFFSPAAAALLSFALWDVVSRARLVAFTGGLTLIAVLRVTLVRSFPKATTDVLLVKRWEQIFVASIVLVDLFWGIGGLFLLVPDSLAYRGLVFTFLMLMAGGHSASYSAHPLTVILGVVALVVPISVYFAAQGDTFHGALAIAAAMYLAATFRSIKTLGYFFGRTHRLAHEVQRERDRAEKLARTDVLTGLNNRRSFYELGEASLRHAKRYRHPAVLVMLDIDFFKSINDRFGHGAGDTVIRTVAQLIREQHRTTDITGRLGGEEFAVLLPETPLLEALLVAERLRAHIAGHVVVHEPHTLQVTVSAGVAAWQPDETLGELIARADAALYTAKNSGRNNVHSLPPVSV
jgi:diguanylate cyclase (GGDEF)-like protein